MIDKDAILASMTPDIAARFRTAIELGKWPDGRKLTEEQRQTCMQAVVVWEHEHLPENERTGYIHKPKKDEPCASHDDANDAEQPVIFKH